MILVLLTGNSLNSSHMRALDTETTTINNGDPFHPDNRLVNIGTYDGTKYNLLHKQENWNGSFNVLDKPIVVGHNIKFDLHWLRRVNIDVSTWRVRDTQLAEYILSNQTHAYASLNELAEKYLGQQKIDTIKLNYWDKGIDTWFIPQQELEEYLCEDLRLTLEVYKIQENLLKQSGKWNLFLLHCADLLVLEDMEYNGIPYDKETSVLKGNDLEFSITDLKNKIISKSLCPDYFNYGSGDHLSCLLYGGTITEELRVQVGLFKKGIKAGLPRFSILRKEHHHPRLVEPLKGSELKKKGFFSTDEQTLLSLKPKDKEIKQLLKDILEISKLEKLRGTYYHGIPKLMDEKGWSDNIIHGQLNQCVVRTGRLSSSNPNQQNFDPNVKKLCYSRYI